MPYSTRTLFSRMVSCTLFSLTGSELQTGFHLQVQNYKLIYTLSNTVYYHQMCTSWCTHQEHSGLFCHSLYWTFGTSLQDLHENIYSQVMYLRYILVL